jgi:replicative DNA helicase
MESGQALPQSLEAERAVLGALMLNSELAFTVVEILTAEDFLRDAHGRLFRLMTAMAEEGSRCDPVTVIDRIQTSERIEDYGGATYISSLPEQVPSIENVGYYANIVRDKAVRRRLLAVSHRVAELATGGPSLPEALDEAEKAVFEVSEGQVKRDWYHVKKVIDVEFNRIQDLSERRGAVTGVSTGYVDLDRVLAGFQKGELIVLASRPSMGKTALALNFARNAALFAGVGVGIFSLEMPRGQIVARLLCAEARVDATRVRTGHLSANEDWPRLTDAAEALYGRDIYIDDTPVLTVTQMRSKARRLKAECPSIGLIVVDYLQLMQGTGGPRESREQAISGISRGLKALAKELEIPVLALSQLNRGVEARESKRPMLADLRESGAIEQDADVILFIYREDYYKKKDVEVPAVSVTDVIVAKQRNGPIDTIRLAFQGQYQRFDSLDPRSEVGGYV